MSTGSIYCKWSGIIQNLFKFLSTWGKSFSLYSPFNISKKVEKYFNDNLSFAIIFLRVKNDVQSTIRSINNLLKDMKALTIGTKRLMKEH